MYLGNLNNETRGAGALSNREGDKDCLKYGVTAAQATRSSGPGSRAEQGQGLGVEPRGGDEGSAPERGSEGDLRNRARALIVGMVRVGSEAETPRLEVMFRITADG